MQRPIRFWRHARARRLFPPWITCTPARMCPLQLAALIMLVIVILVVAGGARPAERDKDGYLIAPYLDLDGPGERGSYYALSGP